MKSGGAPLTFPTLEGAAGEALGSKPKASHCVRVGASSLINLTAKGHGLRVQRTEGHRLGAKKGGEWSWSHGVVAFLMGQKRLEVNLGEPDRKQEWGRQTSSAKAGATDGEGLVPGVSGTLESGRGLKALLSLSPEG